MAGQKAPPLRQGLSQKGPSPIKLPVLAAWLRNYSNQVDAKFLFEGFMFGFRIPYLGPRIPMFSRNQSSIRGMEGVVREKIAKEVRAGRVLAHSRFPLRLTCGFHLWV